MFDADDEGPVQAGGERDLLLSQLGVQSGFPDLLAYLATTREDPV